MEKLPCSSNQLSYEATDVESWHPRSPAWQAGTLTTEEAPELRVFQWNWPKVSVKLFEMRHGISIYEPPQLSLSFSLSPLNESDDRGGTRSMRQTV